MGQEPDQLKQDIEATRAELGRDVDALADKVSPKRVVSRRVDAARGAVSGVKEKVMGTASSAGSSTSGALTDRAGAVGGTVSDAVSTAKAKAEGNPLAAGVVAFGVGWLVSSLLPASGKEKQAAARMTELAKDKGAPLAGEIGQAARAVAADVKDPARHAADSVRGSVSEAADTVSDKGRDAVADIRSGSGSEDDDEPSGAWGTPASGAGTYPLDPTIPPTTSVYGQP